MTRALAALYTTLTTRLLVTLPVILSETLLKLTPTEAGAEFSMQREAKLVILPVILLATRLQMVKAGAEFSTQREAKLVILPVILLVILQEGTGVQFTTTTGLLAILPVTLLGILSRAWAERYSTLITL